VKGICAGLLIGGLLIADVATHLTCLQRGKVRDENAYILGDVRLAGLTGTTTGISSWTGHTAVALYTCSIAATYTLLICCVVFTALYTNDKDRRKTAVRVLGILTGAAVFLAKAEAFGEVQNPDKGDKAS
jgi:hypothetical protein